MSEQNNIRIKLVFNTENNSFKEFESIFYDLKHAEKIIYWYTRDYGNNFPYKSFQIPTKLEQEVYFISKQSPLEIGTFIQENWKEFILLIGFLSKYPQIKSGSKELLKDLDFLVNEIESKLKEIFSDFPSLEKELILDFVNWFLSKNEIEKNYIIGRYRYLKRSLFKIRSIFIDREST